MNNNQGSEFYNSYEFLKFYDDKKKSLKNIRIKKFRFFYLLINIAYFAYIRNRLGPSDIVTKNEYRHRINNKEMNITKVT